MTFSTPGIFAVVTQATSGGRRESVTWQASPCTVLRARTRDCQVPSGQLPGDREHGRSLQPEPEVPRVPTVPARPAAPPRASLLSGFGCCLRARRSQPSRPDSGASPRPGQVVAAGGQKTRTRHASTLTCHPRVFRFSGLQVPALGFPVGALRLGAAVDPDGSVLP